MSRLNVLISTSVAAVVAACLAPTAIMAQTVTIEPPIFMGTGLNDAASGGRFASPDGNAQYSVVISATGAPDSFRWSKNRGALSSPVAMTGSAQLLADGVTVTFGATRGHTLNDSWTITATANGSVSSYSFVQKGTGALVARNAQDKLRELVSVEDFGGKGDYNFTSKTGTDNCPAYRKLGSIGGVIYFPTGAYYSSCTFVTAIPTQFIGTGGGVNTCAAARTCLVFAAGVPGITTSLGSRDSSVRDMWIDSLDTEANSDHGVEIGDSRFSAYQITISGFGGDGLYCSALDPCDKQYIVNSYFLKNRGAGWHCGSTPDCNAGTLINDSAQKNKIGFYEESGGPNTFISNDTSDNTESDFDINGTSEIFLNPYCEGSGSFILRAAFSYIDSPLAGGCKITNPGGPSNTIKLNHQYFDPIGIGPITGASEMPALPTYYSLHSGSIGRGQLDLHDDTNNRPIYHYNPASTPPMFTFDQAVTFSKPVTFDIFQGSPPDQVLFRTTAGSGLILFRNDNHGSGTVNILTRMDGTDSTSSEASYAAIYSAIQDNSHGAQKGSLHLQTAQAGKLIDSLVMNADGTVSVPGATMTVGGSPVVTGSGFTGMKIRTECTTLTGGVPSGCSNITEHYVNGLLQ